MFSIRMHHAHGLFLSQPITTLENVSYISLAQPELKKLWIISQTNYLTVAYLLVDNVVGIATDTIMLLAHNKQLLLVYA